MLKRENDLPSLFLMPCLGIVILTAVAGCGGSSADSALAQLNDSNIKRLANLYGAHQLEKNWRGPADEVAMKQFIEEQGEQRMSRIGVDSGSLDKLFISERDKQPFKIRWDLQTVSRGPSTAVIFEAEGVNGMRQVAFTGGELVEVDASEYEALWSGQRDPVLPGNSPAGEAADTRPGGEPVRGGQ